MSRPLSSILSVSSATLLSRIFGLLRDGLIFAALGTSVWNSAFLLAFTLPNLLRRLLGEGALTSALIPVLAETRERDGAPAAFSFLDHLLGRLTLLLLGLVVLGWGALFLLQQPALNVPERWVLVFQLLEILLPYLIFVCLSAAFAATLNVWNQFLWPSLSPVWLNLCMIASLLPFLFGERDPFRLVFFLCLGVLAGGIIQVLLPALLTIRLGWRPLKGFHHEVSTARLTQFSGLLLPSLVGAAILQINILVSRLLAFFASPEGVAQLYLAARLVEFPLGLFAIAISTVFFPLLAQHSAVGDRSAFRRAYEEGLLLTVALTLPAALGLALLGLPILTVLFGWGAFTSVEARTVYPLLVIYSAGIPFYALAGYLTRNFHARQDMRTPVRAALYTLLLNLVLSLALLPVLGVPALALANVLASAYQTLWLAHRESVRPDRDPLRLWRIALPKLVLALIPLVSVCIPAFLWRDLLVDLSKFQGLLTLFLMVASAGFLYLITLWVLRYPGLSRVLRFPSNRAVHA